MTTSAIEFFIAAKTIRRITPVLSEPAYSVLVDNGRRTEPIYFKMNYKYISSKEGFVLPYIPS